MTEILKKTPVFSWADMPSTPIQNFKNVQHQAICKSRDRNAVSEAATKFVLNSLWISREAVKS